MLVLLAVAGRVARAQTAPAHERPRPRPGVILDAPAQGRITDAPQPPAQSVTGQIVERFEAVGNASVASDTSGSAAPSKMAETKQKTNVPTIRIDLECAAVPGCSGRA